MSALPDLLADRAARTRGQHRQGRPPGGRGTGIEVLVGYFHAMEAMAWTAAGDYEAARRPAMEAVEVARKVQNPALSATAFYAAATAIWPSEPQTALTLIEDSLVLTRAGAFDSILGFALSLAGAIRARNDDLPGALAVLHEATAQQYGDGNRLGLGMTLQRAAAVLAQLGEAEPAAVLAGAVSAHFPLSISATHHYERLEIDEAQSLARRALGEAAYSAALGRGAAMDDHEVADYALGEFRGSPSCSQNPARRHRNHRQPGAAEPAGMIAAPGRATCRSRAARSATKVIPVSPQGGDRPAPRRAARWRTVRLPSAATTGLPKCSSRRQCCRRHVIAWRS